MEELGALALRVLAAVTAAVVGSAVGTGVALRRTGHARFVATAFLTAAMHVVVIVSIAWAGAPPGFMVLTVAVPATARWTVLRGPSGGRNFRGKDSPHRRT